MINRKELALDDEKIKEIYQIVVPKSKARKKKPLDRFLTIEQVLLLENHLKEEKWKIALLLSFCCGLRIGELARLRVGDFYWTEWYENQEEPGDASVFGKGSKERLIQVPPSIMRRLHNHIQEIGQMQERYYPLFINLYNENQRPESLIQVWSIKLKQAAISAGITKLDSEGKPIKETTVHPHMLRHGLGTHLAEVENKDIEIIKEILGHSNISSTQRYVHLSRKKIKGEIKTVFQ